MFRKRGKGKTGHSLNGSVLGYNTDPAGEKLLPPNGTLNRYVFDIANVGHDADYAAQRWNPYFAVFNSKFDSKSAKSVILNLNSNS